MGHAAPNKKLPRYHQPPPNPERNPESKPRWSLVKELDDYPPVTEVLTVRRVPHEVRAPWVQADGTTVVPACRACGRTPEKPVVLNRSQRTKCRDCGWTYVAPGERPEPPREVTDEEVERAIEMALREFMAWPSEWDPMHVPDAVAQLELDIELALARVSGPEGCRFFSPFRTPKMTGPPDPSNIERGGAFWPFTSPNHAWRTALAEWFAGAPDFTWLARILMPLLGLFLLAWETIGDQANHVAVYMVAFVMVGGPLARTIESVIEQVIDAKADQDDSGPGEDETY